MRTARSTYCLLVFNLFIWCGFAQQTTYNISSAYQEARELAFVGDREAAEQVLKNILSKDSANTKANVLMASVTSWNRNYDKARRTFNKILSGKKSDATIWISAIKNELYAKEYATALGLANKALVYVQDNEIVRLKAMALEKLEDVKYSELGWHNTDSKVKGRRSKKKAIKIVAKINNEILEKDKGPKNRIGINNAVTIFNERFDPMIFSNISFKHKTKFGSIIPRINYSNRVGRQGLQYDLDLYPKLAKKVYAYLNYGYSDAPIYPRHKMGGDIYVSLPGAFEVSAGGRHIVTNTRNVTGITNSFGHYRGNYYFSLRSFITPRPDGLTRVSGNLLIRKYLKDAENYMGISGGMGVSPELRQFITDGVLLAETIFFIETQRLNFEYQFTSKRNAQNVYKTRIGLRRQELSFDSGNFFWGVTAGLNYSVKF
jgi:YaiO family outer membrane protein